jgi:AcrR family transcriptional regulator
MPEQQPRRMGRRPGPTRTREQILAAARASFAKRGYEGTSLRAVAISAGVDPALVRRFFGSKEQLLVAAMRDALLVAEQLDEVFAGRRDKLGARIVDYTLKLWDRPRNREVLLAMARTATTNPRGAKLLRDFIGGEILKRMADKLDPAEVPLRASLVGSQMIGLIVYRYILKLEPLASASDEELIAAFAPTLQRYLTGKVS